MGADRDTARLGEALERFYMGEALRMAYAVAGRTGDNPPVGCVIVKDGGIVARGATQNPNVQGAAPRPPSRGAHAEVMAVRVAQAAGIPVAGADVYVTLEPCSFKGRTPPCASLLASLHPRRVFVGIRDPHPRVNGAGIARLRAAGIEVVEGVLEAPVRILLTGWLARWEGRT